MGFNYLFQIRDKEKSNGQLREELGGVLEKNKNIMEEVYIQYIGVPQNKTKLKQMTHIANYEID